MSGTEGGGDIRGNLKMAGEEGEVQVSAAGVGYHILPPAGCVLRPHDPERSPGGGVKSRLSRPSLSKN